MTGTRTINIFVRTSHVIAILLTFGTGFLTSLAAAEDIRCENNRQRLAELRQERIQIEKGLYPDGMPRYISIEELHADAERVKRDLERDIADLRRGFINLSNQDAKERQLLIQEWGVEWKKEWAEDFAGYFQAFLARANEEIRDLDRLQKIEQEQRFHEGRLRDLGCDRGSPRPRVEPLPGDAEGPQRPPPHSSGDLVLANTEVSPDREEAFAPQGRPQGGDKFTNTATSATLVYTRLTYEGKLIERIEDSFECAMKFSGTSGVLRPGDTVTVTMSGKDTRKPFQLQSDGTVPGSRGITGEVEGNGLKKISGQPCWVGSFTPYHAACTSDFVFEVPPGASKVSIAFRANFGIGVFATYTWEKSR